MFVWYFQDNTLPELLAKLDTGKEFYHSFLFLESHMCSDIHNKTSIKNIALNLCNFTRHAMFSQKISF